jgi:hypothetical protein
MPKEVIARHPLVENNMWRVRDAESDFWKERGKDFPVADAA